MIGTLPLGLGVKERSRGWWFWTCQPPFNVREWQSPYLRAFMMGLHIALTERESPYLWAITIIYKAITKREKERESPYLRAIISCIALTEGARESPFIEAILTTLDAHLVIRSAKDYLLLGKIHCLLAPGALSGHLVNVAPWGQATKKLTHTLWRK